jgi:hypothetical protein
MRWRLRIAAVAFAAAVMPGCIDLENFDLGPRSLGSTGGYGSSFPYDDDALDAEWERREHERYACSEIADRIDYDRDKIEEISPTGRHEKALQWYRDDLRNAERERERCRAAGYTGWRSEKRERREDTQWEREEQRRRRQEQARREQQQRAQLSQECDKMRERIRFDQSKVDEIAPTGQHKKALQWYKDDIANAQRFLQQKCR